MEPHELTLTLPLMSGPLSALKTLKGAPVSCLFAMLIARNPVRQSWLCQATGYSSNSVTAALRLLEYLTLIERAPIREQGWQVATGYAALLDCSEPLPPSTPDRYLPADPMAVTSDGWDLIQNNQGEVGEQSEGFAQDTPPTSNRDRESKEVVESLIKESTTATDLKDSPAQIEAQTERILEASSLLFGERIHGPPSRYPNPLLLLATIAEAYTHRHQLRKPARVAYANLKNGVIPPQRFFEAPCRFLPADFLLAAGLPAPPEQPESSEHDHPDPEPDEPNHPMKHSSLSLPVKGQGDSERTADDAWEIAYRTLKDELPRSVFFRWVERLELIEYEPDGCVFTLQAESPKTRDWLDDRLTAKLTRLLNGICARQVSVRFTAR